MKGEVVETPLPKTKLHLLNAWPVIGTTVTVAIGLCTVLLHFLGLAVHHTYLSAWGVDSNQFEKSTDWLLLNGYYGAWNGIAMLLLAALKNWHWVVLSSILFVFYVFALLSPWNPFDRADKYLDKTKQWPKWGRVVAGLSILGGMLGLLIVPMLITAFALVSIPASAGRMIAKEVVSSHVVDYAKGCEASKAICVQLFRSEQRIGEGYVLDSSSTHIAYFDIGLNVARVLPKEGLELRSTRLPSSR